MKNKEVWRQVLRITIENPWYTVDFCNGTIRVLDNGVIVFSSNWVD